MCLLILMLSIGWEHEYVNRGTQRKFVEKGFVSWARVLKSKKIP